MAVTSGFFDSVSGDRKYNALQMSSIFDGVISDGVINGYLSSLEVIASGVANTIVVGSGRAWFDHTWIYNDSALSITLTNAPGSGTRVDAIVIDVNRTSGVRAATIVKVDGPGGATKPTLVNTTDRKQYALAYVTRAAGLAMVQSGSIENARGTTATPYSRVRVSDVEISTLANSTTLADTDVLLKQTPGSLSVKITAATLRSLIVNISKFTSVSIVNDTDLVHTRTSGGANQQITAANFRNQLFQISKFTSVTTVADSDIFYKENASGARHSIIASSFRQQIVDISKFTTNTSVAGTDFALIRSGSNNRNITIANLSRWVSNSKTFLEYPLITNPGTNLNWSDTFAISRDSAQPAYRVSLENIRESIFRGAHGHRSMYRGSSLGTSISTAQANEIAAGSFSGLWIGDYWTIGGFNFRIVDLNYYSSTSGAVSSYNHVVVMPDAASLETALWHNTSANVSYFSSYIDKLCGSTLGGGGSPPPAASVNAWYSALSSNAKTDSYRNVIASSVVNSGGRVTSVDVLPRFAALPTERQIFGTHTMEPTTSELSVAITRTYDSIQFAAFRANPVFKSAFSNGNWWLRDITSGTQAAYVSTSGLLYNGIRNNTGTPYMVRPVMCLAVR
ncbi:MAG TPA: hypothetical protein PKD68_00120 [Candidatus Saccharibacteria bacterium]|nr:hypothetical protein [Candidatus Saccharibacteria bacterium]